ncbi:hypothetical protein C0J52_07889, partial [Blattella germanica]
AIETGHKHEPNLILTKISHNEINILRFSKYSWPHNYLNYFHNFLVRGGRRRRGVHRSIYFVPLRVYTNSSVANNMGIQARLG